MLSAEFMVILYVVRTYWSIHLDNLSHVREASHIRHSRSMVDNAGSQRSDNFFGRKIVPGEEIIVSANESLVVVFY
jgi:preprotein translocase subunit SecA